jgi:hypothetical protein
MLYDYTLGRRDMKTRLTFSVLLLLVVSFDFGLARQPQQRGNSCGFTVQGEPAQPTVKGPEDIVPLVYVVEQPDSPIEGVSAELTGTWLSVSHEQHTERYCAKYRIRNRSDRTVQKSEVMLMLSTTAGAGGGSGTFSSSPLPPGQAVDVESCGSGGNGSAKDDYIRLLVYVDKADFEDCHYKPSLRIPRSLKVHTVW